MLTEFLKSLWFAWLLLIPAHPGCPGQNPKSRKTVVYVCVAWLL